MLAGQDINRPIKILLLGSNSGIGDTFIKSTQDLDVFNVHPLSIEEFDKTDFSSFDQSHYDFVLDALSLYKASSKGYYDQMKACNRWLSSSSTQLLMLSSSLVFSGAKRASYDETDEPDSEENYGKSLAKIEKLALEHSDNIVLRSGWLFEQGSSKTSVLRNEPLSNKQKDFIRETIEQAKSGKPLSYQDDFLGSPTPVRDLMRVTLSLMQQRYYGAQNAGIYHYCCAEEISWLGYAKTIVGIAAQFDPNLDVNADGLDEFSEQSNEVNTEFYRQSLSCRKIFNHFGVKQRPWRTNLKNLIKGLYQVGEF